MTLADHGVAPRQPRRLRFGLGTVFGRARRATRRHPVLVAAAVLVAGGGAAAAAAVAWNSSSPVPAWVTSECGNGVSGHGFRVFACMSGGAAAGHPHPKELLVIQGGVPSHAYPAFRVGEFAVGHGEVVATYNIGLVRVTSRRLVPLLTSGELARALHVRPTAIMDIYHPRVDAHGNLYFAASVISRHHHGCRNPLLELTADGTIHQTRPSTSQNDICR